MITNFLSGRLLGAGHNHTFHSELVPVDLSIFEETEQENIKVFELYEINSVDEYIRFELLNSVKNDIVIKKCKNCGQYFIPFGRSDTEYCDRQAPGSKKSCNQIGPMQKYKAKISGNEIYIAYNKAYRRNNSRVRNKKMSQSDFFEWSEQARNKRDECYNGTITLGEFQQWLNFR